MDDARPAITIRAATSTDRDAVAHVHTLAFERADEAGLVAALEDSPAFVPELSLVADEDGEVVGHVLFTRAQVCLRSPDGDRTGGDRSGGGLLCLAPIGVLPRRQRTGIGSALIAAGLQEARRSGFRAVVVIGHPGYYPRFGFREARPLGLDALFPVPDEAFMVLELAPDGLKGMTGTIVFAPPFADID